MQQTVENSSGDRNIRPPDLRNLYAGQEATVRTGHGTTDWFQIGNCLFNFYAEHTMRNAGLDEAQMMVGLDHCQKTHVHFDIGCLGRCESSESKVPCRIPSLSCF